MLFYAAVFEISRHDGGAHGSAPDQVGAPETEPALPVPVRPSGTSWLWTPSGGIHEEGIYLLNGSMIPVAVGGGEGQMQQFTAEVVLIDENDKFEEDPDGALRARGNTLENYQMVRNGTPASADESLIGWHYYENSNRCKPWVVCCLCGKETPLAFIERAPRRGVVPVLRRRMGTGSTSGRCRPIWVPERPEITDHWGFQASTLISA